MSSDAPETPGGFEESMQALEAIVTRMESETLSLEESIEEYQRGLALVQACQEALENAQRRIAGSLQEPTDSDAEAKDSKDATKYPEIRDGDADESSR